MLPHAPRYVSPIRQLGSQTYSPQVALLTPRGSVARRTPMEKVANHKGFRVGDELTRLFRHARRSHSPRL